MNKLQLNIEPGFESHDFQVRIVIDDIDLFPELLGLDPNDFFKQELYKENNEIIIARCGCGIIGCFDKTSKITFPDTTKIKWEIPNSIEYVFLRKEYVHTLEEAINDKSWETFERRTERLIGSELINYIYLNDYKLDWVSLRNSKNQIEISFTRRNPKEYTHQEIVKIEWDGINTENAIQKVRKLRDESENFKKYQ